MMSHSEDEVLLMLMACLFPVRYDSNHCSGTPQTLISSYRRWNRMLWSTVSNAADKSRRMKITACCLSTAHKRSLVTGTRAVSCCEPDGMLTAKARIADCPGGVSVDGQRLPSPRLWRCTGDSTLVCSY